MHTFSANIVKGWRADAICSCPLLCIERWLTWTSAAQRLSQPPASLQRRLVATAGRANTNSVATIRSSSPSRRVDALTLTTRRQCSFWAGSADLLEWGFRFQYYTPVFLMWGDDLDQLLHFPYPTRVSDSLKPLVLNCKSQLISSFQFWAFTPPSNHAFKWPRLFWVFEAARIVQYFAYIRDFVFTSKAVLSAHDFSFTSNNSNIYMYLTLHLWHSFQFFTFTSNSLLLQ